MNRIRDLIYNVSDILVTLIIIAAALLLISWRVSAIMDYGTKDDPADSQSQGQIVVHDDLSADPEPADTSGDPATDTAAPADGAPADAATTGGQVITFQLTDSGSSEDVAAQLAAAGIISDTKTFLSAANAAGADTKLRNGTFEIPVGSTPEDIVSILIS